ncbi:NUDIX domain-containing protein [Streptomyces sp. B-S-A8]|uniref:NUDIX domain-containing protein n=1 Tax=Streptomyces solicavernae TaxID=3043614 RepID=A0ABT6RZI3_9ACTN|nr:NUDIX domain-containing protein [Streptomyces sp. B-S-A8]MDI3389138.1 NUDIX domain-containing protein [Streptomyces sp. B-S-A8]
MTEVRTRVSAYALALGEGLLLLTRLSASSPVFAPGLWHLPGGGIDYGEQPMEALARELREETGLELVDARLVDARTYAARRDGVDWHMTGLFYAVELKADAPEVGEVDGSTDAVSWIPLSDLREWMLSPAAADAVRMLGDGTASALTPEMPGRGSSR